MGAFVHDIVRLNLQDIVLPLINNGHYTPFSFKIVK